MSLVLMVEDNPTNRKLMRDILEIRFEVAEVGSAEEALVFLQQNKPDLIVLDLQSPGMDGLTFASQVKQDPHFQSIPIVAVSAHAMQQEIDKAKAAGCADYVTKPIVEDPFSLVERFELLILTKTQPRSEGEA